MTEEQENQCINFVGNFIKGMRDEMPNLAEKQMLPLVRVATSTLLGAVLGLAPTDAILQRVARIIKIAIFREYHPERPFVVIVDDEQTRG